MIQNAIQKLAQNHALDQNEAKNVMEEIMQGNCSPALIASYLTALKMKKETIEEIVGSAQGMRSAAIQIHPKDEVFEIVGTGGDHSNTFNISTTASFVIASAGIKVAKHGNRAASSKCGAADCLEALGLNLNATPKQCLDSLETANICFLYAPNHHPAMKYAAPVRKELKIPTIFNILGPLTNPAQATTQVMGVFSKDLVETMAHVLSQLGVKRGLVVYGLDGLDEISMSDATYVCEIDQGQFHTYTIEPEQFGYERQPKEALVGGNAQENAKITLDILQGKERGAKRQAVCLNAGAALYAANKANSLLEGVRLAERQLDSFAPYNTLQKMIEASYA